MKIDTVIALLLMPEYSEKMKKILSKIYSSQFVEEPQLTYLSEELSMAKNVLNKEISILKKKGMVIGSQRFRVSDSGRRAISVVMTGGTFDILHPGHLETLEKARALGDVLVVSVARDATFRRSKGRNPVNDEQLRRKLVSSLKMVDAALLGSEQEILETAVLVSPDIIALGYDQTHDDGEMRKELARRGVNVKIVRLKSSIPGIKTRDILESYHATG